MKSTHKLSGNNVYKALAAQDIGQAELARIIGIERSYLNRVINGKILPSVALAIKIAKALGRQVEDLFFL